MSHAGPPRPGAMPRDVAAIGAELSRAIHSDHRRRRARRSRALRASVVLALLAVGSGTALAARVALGTGRLLNPCIARAVGHPWAYPSRAQEELACHGPDSRQVPSPPPPLPGRHGHLLTALQMSFPVLRLPRTAADALPADALQSLERTHRAALDLTASRLVVSKGWARMWLVPGPTHLCGVEMARPAGALAVACEANRRAQMVGVVWRSGQHVLLGILPLRSSDVTVSTEAGRRVVLAPDRREAIAFDSVQPLASASWVGPYGVPSQLAPDQQESSIASAAHEPP